ncbi:carboxypeptidase-like regulatory domain-containing protein [Lacinutrix iliipiscaria]|uniref:Carboxypeptidase-like regulatory domain-containing protein n=1 Tax=Lacinutrix iliipiscaria TaxID=1230532 RepID=A0ABW5WL92_9FLAO
MITGKIASKSKDVEGITLYNTTSKKGTITNHEGLFFIEAAIGDSVEISALLYEQITIVIDAETIKNKKLTIQLVEEVNTLDEVLILTHDLTGDLTTDIDNVEPLNLISFNGINTDNIAPGDIRMTKPDNPFMKQGQFYNGLNIIELLKLFGVKFKKKKKRSYIEVQKMKASEMLDLADKYSPSFMVENFKIPKEKLELFYAFCYHQNFDNNLLKTENEVALIEFLVKKSKMFLNTLDEEN